MGILTNAIVENWSDEKIEETVKQIKRGLKTCKEDLKILNEIKQERSIAIRRDKFWKELMEAEKKHRELIEKWNRQDY